ncbi:MAG: hypothetical protein IJW70_11525 [Clostridia bacterium]|nr:hypothetical protein [Clostridia bacterium]
MNKNQKCIWIFAAVLAAILTSVLVGAIVWIMTGNGNGLIRDLLQPKPQTEQEYLDSIIDHDGVNRPCIEQFDQVKEGMTLEQAIELVGKPNGYSIYKGEYDFYWLTDQEHPISMGIAFEDENADELSRWENAIVIRILK